MVEAFLAILLITMFLFILVSRENIQSKFNENVYAEETRILKSIEMNKSMREEIHNIGNLPVAWDDANFPIEVKNKIINENPNYLNCTAKICEIKDDCLSDEISDVDIYSRSVGIFASETRYKPRQLKMFCWVGAPGEVVEVGVYCGDGNCDADEGETSDNCPEDCPVSPPEPEKTCAELGGEVCGEGYYCIEDYLSANDSDECCPVGSCVESPLPEAVLTLSFSDVVYSWEYNEEDEGWAHHYYHTRTFIESGGVGVTLTEGQVCLQSKLECNPKVSVNYRIEGNNELIHENKRFWTTASSDIFTLTYWGADDNGYDIMISQRMCVNKENFIENCDF